MIHLIIVVIAIILSVLIGAIEMNYMGTSVDASTAKIEAIKILNEGEQIKSSIVMAYNSGSMPSINSVSDIPPEFINNLPDNGVGWDLNNGVLYKRGVADTVCYQANSGTGYVFTAADPNVRDIGDNQFVPICTASTALRGVVCCTE
jgi:hypothetical protein